MPPSSPQSNLILYYSPWKKQLALLGLGGMLFVTWVALSVNFFILEIVCVLMSAYLFRHVADIFNTRSITLFPDKIVKNTYLGPSTIPTHALVVKANHDQQSWHCLHGSGKNIREAIAIPGWYLADEHKLWLQSYLRNTYRSGSSQPSTANNAACVEFERAASSFRLMLILTGVYLLIYLIYATVLHWQYPVFNGYASQWPALPIRLLFAGLALAVYPWLLSLAAEAGPASSSSYTAKVQGAQRRCLYSALLAHSVIWLGLPLFLLFGNKLDFYALLLLGATYHYDFYPRLSAWERLLRIGVAVDPAQTAAVPRRSLQVSLALLGGLSLAGQAGNPDDFRIHQRECRDDIGNPAECRNSGGHSGSWSGARSSSVSDNRSPVRRGGFGFFGGSHGSFGG